MDHISGVGRAKEVLNVPIGLHKDDLFLYRGVVEQGLAFGFDIDPQPPVDFFYDGPGPWRFGDYGAWVHHTPGHCPGGVCLAIRKHRADGQPVESEKPLLIVGDTLFAGGIGRTDLPGGDMPTLLRSITEVLFRFPDDCIVYSGHGPTTTIGREKRTNPYLSGF
jgi:hydroxyacylglutathione hydrolase